MKPMTRQLDVLSRYPFDPLLKIAFASTDRTQINQHFGSARSFFIYGLDCDHYDLLACSQFGELLEDGREDKLAIKMKALVGCAAVYSQACGASAAKQLLARGIQPLKAPAGSLIRELIRDLQHTMKTRPSPWLAKAMGQCDKPDESRFDKMAAEEWLE